MKFSEVQPYTVDNDHVDFRGGLSLVAQRCSSARVECGALGETTVLSLGSKSHRGVAQGLPGLYLALNKLLTAPAVSVSWICAAHTAPRPEVTPSASPSPGTGTVPGRTKGMMI